VETLLIGGKLDFATPPQWATRELLPHLPNGHQVVLGNLGHTDDFWSYEPAASDRLINTFFDTGRVDTSLYARNRVDFTPSMSQGAIAKITAGVMLAVAALTVLSLLWLPLRVRSRGAFGRKGSAVLRSLYGVVLGLGGWFVGVLIVLTALPRVPLQDELLASLSVGSSVGLALYFAWVHTDWSGQSKATGFAAAAGGALVGAWLGFNVTSAGFGLLAPLLAIVGTTAGGNLTLLGLDMAWDWQARDRRAREETLEPQASTG
jgi:hypothetical protein